MPFQTKSSNLAARVIIISIWICIIDAFSLLTRHDERRLCRSQLPVVLSSSLHDNVDVDDFNDDDPAESFQVELPDDSREKLFSQKELESLTILQLKQQLRLRGLKVSGRKADLVNRFLKNQSSNSRLSSSSNMFENDPEYEMHSQERAREVAKNQGKEFFDVSDYLEEEDLGKATKTWKGYVGDMEDESEENEMVEPEIWGTDARIVDDYEEGRIVVDCLSRSMIQFKGSNQTEVQAFVVASRDALKPFLAGGRNPENITRSATPAEERLREIQTRREEAARRPIRFENQAVVDEGDETGLYKDALHRDYSDWGLYTTTGAQLSAEEVQGVLLLSDVYGPFTNDTKTLAEKIAFECQPVVVMVPDMFRGDHWTGPTSGVNAKGQSYNQWRQEHPALRVNIDIRAAAACLRERYGVSSLVVWGTCYGGGRALEAAAGWSPGRSVHDMDGKIGPPPVDPMACVAWYPTRYNLQELFGSSHSMKTSNGNAKNVAVMAVFAGKDTIPGARPTDAEALKDALVVDERVKDHMIKVFPDQDHGFAHVGISQQAESDDLNRFVDDEFGAGPTISLSDGDAEVACLLSTAFMETYSRVFLPTVGPPIRVDAGEVGWVTNPEMKVTNNANRRDVRKEIEDATNSFVGEPLQGYRIDPTDESQEEEMKKLLRSMEGPDQKAGPYAIEDDDDLELMYAKLKAYDKNFQLF